jgi:hypothetical protein
LYLEMPAAQLSEVGVEKAFDFLTHPGYHDPQFVAVIVAFAGHQGG